MNYPAVRDSNALENYQVRPVFDADAETAVIAAVQARADADLVYSFKQGDGLVTELTVYGVFETARELNQRGFSRIAISDREPTITETDAYIEVRVYAKDDLSGSGAWGIKRQDKYRSGKPIPFAMELALSKAQRNAIRKIIPSQVAKAMIQHRLMAAGQRATVREDDTIRQVPASTRAQLGTAAQTETPEPQGAPANDQPLATDAQVKAMYVIARNERQYDQHQFDERCMELFGGLPNELTKREASEVIDRLKAGTL